MYVVLFDIDGTLVQTGGAGQKAFAAAFTELFDVGELSREVPFAGRSDRAIAEDLMEVHGIEPSPQHWHQFLEVYLSNLETTLPQCEGEVLPGVVELLDTLQTRDRVLTGLLTGNVKSGASRKLGHYGLADRFSFGGFGDTCTDRNAIAKEAIEQASTLTEGKLLGTMVIGDTEHDIHCARSIGAFAVAVGTGSASLDELRGCGPDLLLSDLSETDSLLAEVGSS